MQMRDSVEQEKVAGEGSRRRQKAGLIAIATASSATTIVCPRSVLMYAVCGERGWVAECSAVCQR